MVFVGYKIRILQCKYFCSSVARKTTKFDRSAHCSENIFYGPVHIERSAVVVSRRAVSFSTRDFSGGGGGRGTAVRSAARSQYCNYVGNNNYSTSGRARSR